jgi:hypothetical protein
VCNCLLVPSRSAKLARPSLKAETKHDVSLPLRSMKPHLAWCSSPARSVDFGNAHCYRSRVDFWSVTVVDNAASCPTVQTYNLAAASGFWPITLSTGVLSFPSTPVGSASSPLQVTVKNYKYGIHYAREYRGSGRLRHSFAGGESLRPVRVLTAKETCTFGVTFSPTMGAVTRAATLSHSAPNHPQVVALSGLGQ